MSTLLQKMRIKAPHVLCAWNTPADFTTTLGKLPAGISVITDIKKPHDSLHWFVKNKAEVDKETPKLLKVLKPGVTVWCYYPKGTSRIQTDLTRDKGWETLLAHEELKWLSLISFNDTWSTFAFRLKTDKEKTEVTPEQPREIFKYADSKTKTITLPEDLAKALNKNKEAKKRFDALAFSHRREYVEWIVTAKREETRRNRVDGTLEKLVKGLKNPADKGN